MGTPEGAILDLLIQQSPNGFLYGFEPIPSLQKSFERFSAGKTPFTKQAFEEQYDQKLNYYFIASPSWRG